MFRYIRWIFNLIFDCESMFVIFLSMFIDILTCSCDVWLPYLLWWLHMKHKATLIDLLESSVNSSNIIMEKMEIDPNEQTTLSW